MANGHRSQIKRERNAKKDTRPSAKLSYARIPVQKACFVMDAIRGKDVATAMGILEYNTRYASEVILKLLKSAVANAENNLGMSAADLYVAECFATEGPTMKRIKPRAQGRAYRILKRMSHLNIVLDTKKTAEAPTETVEEAPVAEEEAPKKAAAKKPAAKKTAAKKAPAKKASAKKAEPAEEKTEE